MSIYRIKPGTTAPKELKARYYIDEDYDTGNPLQRNIMYVYHAVKEEGKTVGKLVWQAISSCFGAGYWINQYGWKNTDGWKNI